MRSFKLFLMFFLMMMMTKVTFSDRTVEGFVYSVSCERYREASMGFIGGHLECYMQESTSISSDDVTLSDARMESTQGLGGVKTILTFDHNKKILFLLVGLHEKIGNLQKVNANNCGITKISKKNFEKLGRLEYIKLDDNLIEKIPSDTFEDLAGIREIVLSNNRIKFMNSKLFEGLNNLNKISLKNNICIDENLVDMSAFLENVNQKCSFDESQAEGEMTSGLTETLFDIDCGVVSYRKGFVKSGRDTKHGQWPFLVALVLTLNGNFFCGGSLISSKHVLTAAHCIHDKYEKRKLDSDDIAVLVGRHNVKAVYERGSVSRDVEEIFIHPDWKNHTPKYDGDLAILLLSRSVEFSDYIKPVCLTNDVGMLSQFGGTVVGWGKAESEAAHESTPRQVAINAVEDDVCFEKDPDLGKIYSRRTFCAGGGGSGPCTGDSGGGFFVLFKERWTLKGIVSAGAINNGGCDVSRFTLFTKMHDFGLWIKQKTGPT